MLSHLKQLEDGNHIHILTWNIMKYGTYLGIIKNYKFIVMKIINSCVFIGLKAGGNGLTVSEFIDPSALIKMGADFATPFLATNNNLNILGSPLNLMQQLGGSFTQGGIELSFILIAIQVCIVCLEFYVVSALAIMLLPFGVNSHTKFLADKVLPSIVSSELKLMVLAFIMSVAMPIFYERKIELLAYAIANVNIPLTSDQSAESLGVSMALAFLCWNAPSMATGLMNGMGSGLSAGSLSQSKDGMSQMSSTMASSGAGSGVGTMMQGISKAMSAATGNPIPEPETSKQKT